MRRLLVSALTGALVVLAGPALAQGAGPLSVSGRVDGEIAKGERVTLHITVTHRGGAGKIDTVRVALETNGVAVETLVIEPAQFALSIEGSSTTSFLDADPLEGAFFSVRGDAINLETRGKELRLTVPVRILTEPAEGSRLYLSADAGLQETEPVALSEPIEEGSSLSWPAVVIAAGVALFAGAALGGSLASKRGPQDRSVYSSVRRRLEEPAGDGSRPEDAPAGTPAAGSPAPKKAPAGRAGAKRAPAKKAAAKRVPAKTTARKAPAKKAPSRKAAAKKAPAKKAAAKRRPAGGRGRGGRTG